MAELSPERRAGLVELWEQGALWREATYAEAGGRSMAAREASMRANQEFKRIAPSVLADILGVK